MGNTTNKKEDEVNRLHDMLVHEVSLVDRAANATTFLLLKRDEQMGNTGAEVVENENGDLETVTPTPPTDSKSEDVTKVEYSFVKDLKEKLQACTTEALKRLTDVTETVKALPDAPDGGGLPNELALELVTVLELLIGIEHCDVTVKGVFVDNTTKSSALRMLGESMDRLGTVVASVKNATEGDEKEVPATLATEMTAIAHLVGGVIERHSAAPETKGLEKAVKIFTESGAPDARLAILAKAANALKPVAKAGAKMSASRLGKLKTVISQLMDLLADVDPSIAEELLGGVSAAAKVADAPGKKPKGKPSKKEDEVAKASAAEKEELAKTVKALTTQLVAKDAEISRLSKSVAMPNSMVVEHAPSVQPEGPAARVGWPSDMNSPMGKETIKKEHWFTGSK